MSGIAELLHNLHYDVTGSDQAESANTQRLRQMGVGIQIGHRAENVGAAHVLVISSAIRSHNPEVVEARRRGVPVIPRAEMLAELMRLKSGIAVAGSHGKTTTTSLVSTMLAGFDPTVVIGGKLKALGSNARLGQGDLLVAEADESDGSFLLLSPTVAVVTNIDREHMDHFQSMEDLKRGFLEFMNKVPFYGLTIVCKDDQNVRDLLPQVHRRVLTYGITADAQLVAREIVRQGSGSRFKAYLKGAELGEFELPVPGVHNVSNALAAIGVGLELGMNPADISAALATFSGIQRRFELKGEGRGMRIYDDYAHHPAEVRATLLAARNLEPRRLLVVFQPHRYTRTRDLMAEFFGAFHSADRVYLLDIYAASEAPIEGIHARVLESGIREYSRVEVVYRASRNELVRELRKELREGDLLFTMGAGDVYRTGEELAEALNL